MKVQWQKGYFFWDIGQWGPINPQMLVDIANALLFSRTLQQDFIFEDTSYLNHKTWGNKFYIHLDILSLLFT